MIEQVYKISTGNDKAVEKVIYDGSITFYVGFSQVDMEPLSAWFRQPCH